MNILLTGYAGFIGSHTLDCLKESHQITGIDLRSPASLISSMPNKGKYFKTIKGNLSDDSTYDQLSKQSFDVIIHLSAQDEFDMLRTDPTELFRANVTSTHKLLRYAIEHNIDHFIFASSTPIKNQTTYTKTSAELLAKVYHEQYGLSVTTLRFPMVYGPRQAMNAPLSLLAKALIENRAPNNAEIICQQQLYITDAVSALEQSIQLDSTEHRIIDLSNKYITSEGEIIQLMKYALGIESAANEMPQRTPNQKWEDIKIQQSQIKFKTNTPLEIGIDRFCKWFLNQTK